MWLICLRKFTVHDDLVRQFVRRVYRLAADLSRARSRNPYQLGETIGAPGRTRTSTMFPPPDLSQARLPIPPQKLMPRTMRTLGSYGALSATRKPIWRLRMPASPPRLRAAARQNSAVAYHEPPRSTRFLLSPLFHALPSTGTPW